MKKRTKKLLIIIIFISIILFIIMYVVVNKYEAIRQCDLIMKMCVKGHVQLNGTFELCQDKLIEMCR